MANTETQLSKENIKDIKEMFLGPYKDEWRDKNGIVDNTDVTIARRLKLPFHAVSFHTNRLCHELIKVVNSI